MSRSLAQLDWPVTTARLSIRPAVPEDARALFGYRSRPDVAHWLTTWPQSHDDFARHLARRLPAQLVVERAGTLIGDLQLDVRDPWSQAEVRDRAVGTVAEIGYVFDPAYAGQGYATEAVAALVQIAFDGVGVRRVTAQLFADNVGSRRLLERLGLRREQHTVKDSLHRSGEWLDGMMYALLREEWVAARRPTS